MNRDATDPKPAPSVPPPRQNNKARRIVIGVVVLLGIGAGASAYWYRFMRGRITTDDARISGLMVDVSSQVPGKIETVQVAAGDRVTKGQLLFTLDKTSFQAQAAMAKAAVATANAGVELARDQLEKAVHGPRKAEIAAGRATERGLAAERDLAKATWERDQALFAHSAITKVLLDGSRARYQSAEAADEQAAERLRLLEQGTRSEDIEAARVAVKVAEAKVDQAQASLDAALVAVGHTSVAAPFDGVVVRRWLDPGSQVAPGRAVLTVFDPKSVRIDANIEEKQLAEVAIGDRVDIAVDAYPDLQLHGHVVRILAATNSEFSLIPAEGVSGTFIKVAQRIPLRVTIDNPPAKLRLGPGLSVELTIYVGTAGSAKPSAAMSGAR